MLQSNSVSRAWGLMCCRPSNDDWLNMFNCSEVWVTAASLNTCCTVTTNWVLLKSRWPPSYLSSGRFSSWPDFVHWGSSKRYVEFLHPYHSHDVNVHHSEIQTDTWLQSVNQDVQKEKQDPLEWMLISRRRELEPQWQHCVVSAASCFISWFVQKSVQDELNKWHRWSPDCLCLESW